MEDDCSREELNVQSGVYQHFKGGRYLVLGVARHSETDEDLVIYVRLYSRVGNPMSARPLSSFCELVRNSKGDRVPRFRFLGTTENDS